MTTVNESAKNVVVFSFDMFIGDLNVSIAAIKFATFQLQWETANKSSSGLFPVTVIMGREFTQANHTTEDVVTYYFTVAATKLAEGPLLLTLSTRQQCFRYSSDSCNRNPRSWYRCTCSLRIYGLESETIKINAKKGISHILIMHAHTYMYYSIYCYIRTRAEA